MAKLIRRFKRWLVNYWKFGYVLRQDEEDAIVNGKLFGWWSNINDKGE